MNADRQPHLSARKETTGTESAAPKAVPELKIPTANARSRIVREFSVSVHDRA